MQVIDLQSKYTKTKGDLDKKEREVESLQKECQQKERMTEDIQAHCFELKALLESQGRTSRETVAQLKRELEEERFMHSTRELDAPLGHSLTVDLGALGATLVPHRDADGDKFRDKFLEL